MTMVCKFSFRHERETQSRYVPKPRLPRARQAVQDAVRCHPHVDNVVVDVHTTVKRAKQRARLHGKDFKDVYDARRTDKDVSIRHHHGLCPKSVVVGAA